MRARARIVVVTASLAMLILVTPVACRRVPPVASDQIRMGLPVQVTTLDPHASNRRANFSVLSNVYESLVQTARDLSVGPCLATTWESLDSTTWRFRLRPGVAFQSGRRLSSADVVYTFQRLRDDAALEMRTYVIGVKEVVAVDPLTVEIHTQRPTPAFLNKLSFVLIVPAGSTAETLGAKPDGTGPYALSGDLHGRTLVFERNGRYWGRAPVLRRVEVDTDVQADEATHGLVDRRYSFVMCNSVDATNKISPTDRCQVYLQENIYLRYLGFDLRRTVTPYCSARPNPFLNPIVRRAIHIALDRSSLSGSLDSGASPAWQLVPRSIFGFDPLVQPSAGNPERARELLAEAGYVKGGFQVTLHVGAASREGAKAIAEQLAQIGIEVSVQVLSDAEFFGRGSRGEFTMFLLGYGCAAGDAGQILDDVIHTPDRERSFGFHNWGGYSNAAIDEVIEKIPEAPNAVERQRALQNALAVVMKELPLVPVYVGRDTYAFRASYTYLPRYDGYVQLREIGFASGLEP